MRLLLRICTTLLLLLVPSTLLADPAVQTNGQAPGSLPVEPATAMASAFRPVPQKGHTALVTCLDYSKNGRFVLTGSLDGTARLWDSRSAILVRVFDASTSLWQVAFVPDGKRVVTHDENGNLRVFDMATGSLLRTVTTKWSRFPRLRLFADGRRILVSNENKDIRVIDLDSGQTLQQFNECPSDPYPRTNIALSNDDRLMITTCVTGKVQVRDIATGGLVKTHEIPPRSECAPAFLSDGRHAVLFSAHSMYPSGNDSDIEIWDFRADKTVASHKGLKDLVDFSISKSDKTVAVLFRTSLSTGAVELRDLWSFKLLERFKEGVSDNRGIVHLSPDGERLVAPGDLSSVAVFDLATKKRIARLSSEDSGGIERLVSRPNRWQVASASGDGNIYLFDVANASLQKAFSANVQYLTALDYSPDGRFIANVDLTNPNTWEAHSFMAARIWDVATGKQLSKNVQQLSLVRAAAFSADGELLLLGGRKEITVKETKTWRTVGKLPYDDDPNTLSISSDKTKVAIAREASTDGIYDLRTGKRLEPFPLERTKSAQYLPDGRRMLFVNYFGDSELWDMSTKRRIRTYTSFKIDKERALRSATELSGDGTRFVGISQANTLDVWEVETGKLLKSLPLPTRGVRQAVFLPNPDYVAAADSRGVLRVWNLKNDASMSMMASGQDWIVYTDDGYFDGSRGSGKLVAAVNGLSSFRIDQTANRSNRPDIILQRMGLGTPELIRHYAALHQRRLRKLGLSETDLDQALVSAPSVTITSVVKADRNAIIEFDAADSNSELVRYNVYVNDVPIFGLGGKLLTGRRKHIKQTVVLASGDNDIEVGVLNRNGIESMRPSVSVPYLKETSSDLYFLGFGVSKYKHSEFELKFAAKDATDLATQFARNKGFFGKVHVKVYTDQEVTAQAVVQAKAFLADAKVDDTVVLFAAGHGLYAPNSTSDYFYLTYDTELNRLADTAVPFEQLEELLSGIAPRKKLFLLDTCYSGEDGMQASAESFAVAGSRGLMSRGIRRKAFEGSAIPPAPHLFTNRERFIYNDLLRRSGAIVLSSSGGAELSYEKDDLQNGLFTEYVLRALSSTVADLDKNRQVSTDELRGYVADAVSKASGGLQNPVVDRDNLEMHFALPLR